MSTTVLNDLIDNAEPTKTDDNNTNYMEVLVGEGKKYKTPEDLAKAYANADKHIQTLIAEKRELETKFNSTIESQKTIDELLAAIKNGNKTSGGQDQGTAGNTNGTGSVQEKKGLSEEEIAKLVSQKLTEEQTRMQMETRTQSIKAKFLESMGGELAAREAILGYTKGDKTKLAALDNLILADVDVAVKLLKEMKPSDSTSFGEGASAQRSTEQNLSKGLTWKQCQELRKKDPKTYNSVAFQRAIHEAAGKNPNFFNT